MREAGGGCRRAPATRGRGRSAGAGAPRRCQGQELRVLGEGDVRQRQADRAVPLLDRDDVEPRAVADARLGEGRGSRRRGEDVIGERAEVLPRLVPREEVAELRADQLHEASAPPSSSPSRKEKAESIWRWLPTSTSTSAGSSAISGEGLG